MSEKPKLKLTASSKGIRDVEIAIRCNDVYIGKAIVTLAWAEDVWRVINCHSALLATCKDILALLETIERNAGLRGTDWLHLSDSILDARSTICDAQPEIQRER